MSRKYLYYVKKLYLSQIRYNIMRYYEQKYPEVDELVMVQVRQIAEMGAYVKLVRTKDHPYILN
jgi:hypothetical protein